MASKISAAVFVTGAGKPMGEEEGLCLRNTARLTDLTWMADFVIQNVERIIEGWVPMLQRNLVAACIDVL